MADFAKTKPLYYDATQKVHRSMFEGQVVDPALLPISTDSGNELKFGTDGGMYVKGTTPSDMVSVENPNYIQVDREGKLKVDGNTVLSNGGVNLLTIDPVDGRVILTKEAVIAALERASHDEGNLIVPGTDGGCYLSIDNLLGKNNDILHGDDAGKLVADLSLKYNLGTGKLDIIGYDGTTVVSSVTVPTSTSSLRGAYLADGKPSASGEDVTGDYFITIAMQYDGLYDSGASLKFRTHKSTASEVEFEYTVDEEHSGVWPSSIKASFVGDNKIAEVSQERATTIAFSDGSILSITWTGISGIRISGTATFTPAVGIESGSYIRMVHLLDNSDVADVYVDVTSLVDVYVQGNGITISDNTVSVKAKPNGGIMVDSTGVSVDTDWFSQQLGSTLTAGNGINIADNTVSVKPKTNGGLSVDSSGVSVSVGDGISISDAGAIIAKLQQDGGLAIKHGTGEIYVDFSLLPADMLREIVLSMVQEGGGLSVDENGQLYVDFASMPEELLRAIVLSMIQEGGGLAVDETGKLYVDFSSMPTGKFEALLKSIRVPIWLTKNMTIYVATTGSDTLDEGRGLSPDKPFASIKAAVDYVSTTYNLYNYNVTINVEPGNYGRGLITLPSYSTTTGEIIIIGQSRNPDDIVCGRFLLEYASKYSLYNMTVHPNDMTVGTAGAIEASSGIIKLYNIKLRLRNVSTGSGALWGVYARASGFIQIWATQSLDQLNGVIFDCSGATITGLILANSAKIEFAADLSVLGDATMSITTVQAQQNGSIVRGRSSYSNPGRRPNIIVEGTVTGQRYSANMNGIISVANAGPEFWPGSSEGITATGGQYA